MAREAIFVGYRRDDTADVAGRIYDAMSLKFGRERIFKDVDSIGPGVDFGDYIKTVLPRCRVALILIGPQWLTSSDESGGRRIDDTRDWVRIEIETALATPGLLVVPVLINGARMPRDEDVPQGLRPLLRRNAAIIRRDPDFHDDVERLATALRASVNTGVLDLSKIGGQAKTPGNASRARRPSRAPLVIGMAIALLVAGYVAWRFIPLGGGSPSPPQEEAIAEQADETPRGSAAPADAVAPDPQTPAPVSQPAPTIGPAPDFPSGSRMIYSADFTSWLNTNQHGSLSLGFGNALVLQPNSNTWIGPGRAIDIPPVSGDFVVDVRFGIEQQSPDASLQFYMAGSGNDATTLTMYVDFWASKNNTYSLERGRLRMGAGLAVPHLVSEDTIAERAPFPTALSGRDWTGNHVLTLRREGGTIMAFVDGVLLRQFSAPLFDVSQISLSAAFVSRIAISSVEFRKP